MARLQFYDYHNMVAILEKSEHNVDFHPMVDFIEASPLRYALTVKPTIYVSHIRQFWSTARIKTTKEGTQILATVDGIHRTITESSLRRNLKLKNEEGINGIQKTMSEASLRRNLKLRDEDGIVSIPDTELFENLTLMGYNISQNQKLTFQKRQFSHQWKYLIHTIMQCLSPKSTGFNEFSSNIATALVCLATNGTYNFSKMIFDGMVKNVNNKGEVAKELEEQQKREDMRMNEQIAIDTEVARIHAEAEIQGMIDSLDKSNETVAKYLQECQQFASELPLEKKIELISDLVKYQEHYT
nr:ribonuclease H-like domain, reverse transcriptase, RNA-dependent DNA polymerase [Tanacetum cinerariifolium]